MITKLDLLYSIIKNNDAISTVDILMTTTLMYSDISTLLTKNVNSTITYVVWFY